MRSQEQREWLEVIMPHEEVMRLFAEAHRLHELHKGMVMNSYCSCGWHNRMTNNPLCSALERMAEFTKATIEVDREMVAWMYD